MSQFRCPRHQVRLVFDERVDESRLVGGIGWQAEERASVERWVCPTPGCHEYEERVS